MTFRLAKMTDLPILNQISFQSKQHWGYPDAWMVRWSDELTLTEEKLRRNTTFVAELNNELIGFCSMTEERDYYEILHLWLRPAYIGRGYGKRLLQHALTTFAVQQKPVRVEADPNAEAFYRGQGFKTIGKVESWPQGRYLPLMEKL